MTDLSPAAAAVLAALDEQFCELNSQHMAAVITALRAAANQVGEWESAEELRAIAAELEGQ